MKIYVLLRNGVPLGYALAAASHCSLWNLANSKRTGVSFFRSYSWQRMNVDDRATL